MPYTAPDIKDRIAVGDNKYATQTLPDNRTMLTPTPDSVPTGVLRISERRRHYCNRHLTRLAARVTSLLPYTDYWWRRRTVAGTYYETRVNGYKLPASHSTHNVYNYYYSYICFFTGTQETTTLSYSSSITINQSTGAVSLASPTTVTINATDYTTSSDDVCRKVCQRINARYDRDILYTVIRVCV